MSLTSYRAAPSRDTDMLAFLALRGAAGGRSALRILRIRGLLPRCRSGERVCDTVVPETPKGPPLWDSPLTM